MAGHGTILLDEIAEMPLELQAKLLRFLQDKEFQRVGAENTISSDARIIACTNKDLVQMVSSGSFREDLYYRLHVAKITIPALIDRLPDIPLIVEYLLKKINRNLNKSVERIEARALRRMERYDWPGNVRELENLLTRAVIHTQGNTILDDVVAALLCRKEAPDSGDQRKADKAQILDVLQSTKWHYGNACKILRISYPTLKKRIREYGILPKPHKHGLP